MKFIIVDDERLARRELRRMLSSYPQALCLGEAANLDEGFKLIDCQTAEVVFLNIGLPGQTDPVHAAKQISQKAQVVCTTGFDRRDASLIELGIPILYKPVRPKDLERVLACLAAFSPPC
jgi:two-component system LytT family response regulator